MTARDFTKSIGKIKNILTTEKISFFCFGHQETQN